MARVYDQVPVGDRLLVFGAAHTNNKLPMAAPEVLEPVPLRTIAAGETTRRVVEAGGQTRAEAWTPADDERLHLLVSHAHHHGLWIRFYTLDGATEKEESCNGWFHSYNFGSLDAAEGKMACAAQYAGVDYTASDQYEALGALPRPLEIR